MIFQSTGKLSAQSDEDLINLYRTIEIDSIIVVASKNGFSVEDFILMATQDTTFYAAFHNLRASAYPFTTQIYFYNRKNKVKAHYDNQAVQTIDDQGCRSMNIISENKSKKIKKGDDYRFITMKLFAKAFFTSGVVCSSIKTSASANAKKISKTQKYYSELKKLLFFPDQKISIPMMGQRTQIYSKQMQHYYNYKIKQETYKTGIPCYTFTAEIKPKYQKLNQKKNTVIKKLKLFFSREDFQILGKTYSLDFNSGIYKFDVDMDITLDKIDNHYFPVHIVYDGFWKIPFKSKEKSRFEMYIGPEIVKWDN